jgi:hypothetical protein
MARFHLMHCIPDARAHGLQGYREILETLVWGLRELGHETAYSINNFDPRATNIVFGAHLLPVEVMKRLPADTVVYSLEQARGLKPEQLAAPIHFMARQFQIWDYTEANAQVWRDLGTPRLRIVPIGYAPILTRIPKPGVQDIDVLFYGMSGTSRLNAVHVLSHAGVVVMFVSGLYGPARDELIGRAKLVLNINLYDFANIFEIVRVSYLFANCKAVVALRDAGLFVEPDVEPAVRFTIMEKLVQDCVELLKNDAVRAGLETRGFEVIRKRDIRELLRPALQAL